MLKWELIGSIASFRMGNDMTRANTSIKGLEEKTPLDQSIAFGDMFPYAGLMTYCEVISKDCEVLCKGLRLGEYQGTLLLTSLVTVNAVSNQLVNFMMWRIDLDRQGDWDTIESFLEECEDEKTPFQAIIAELYSHVMVMNQHTSRCSIDMLENGVDAVDVYLSSISRTLARVAVLCSKHITITDPLPYGDIQPQPEQGDAMDAPMSMFDVDDDLSPQEALMKSQEALMEALKDQK